MKLKTGIATNFYAQNDPWNPDNRLYCTGKVMKDSELVVAHPKYRCGTPLWIYNIRTKKSVIAKVEDRGPRSSALDLSLATAKAIKANGFESIIFLPLGK